MILITGGAGFIGSHVNRVLKKLHYETVVFDNLSTGVKEAAMNTPLVVGDLRDKGDLKALFRSYPIEAVMHFAALTDVGESVENPSLYHAVNTQGTINLVEEMKKNGVNRLIFSSTAAVYGFPEKLPIDEKHPTRPINPYGESKLHAEEAIQASGIHASALRYFNAAGGDSEGIFKNFKTKENNLIPLILKSIRSQIPITVFGNDWPTPDGTCIRDYIHVEDLAQAHLLALKDPISAVYNLGTGHGFSVKQVIQAAEKALNLKIDWQIGPRRAGDPPELVAESHLANENLGWRPRFPSLEKILLDAWRALP